MENTNYNFVGPQAIKKFKGEAILLSSPIIWFNEFDEETDVCFYLTKNYVMLKDDKSIVWDFQIEDIESLTIS